MIRQAIPVVYVAGPFRAANAWLREKNIREAEELAFRVAECGAVPLCPHTNSRHFDGTLTEQWWLDATLALLGHCDAAAFTKRWKESSGARSERLFANAHGIQTFNEADVSENLTAWVAQWKETHV